MAVHILNIETSSDVCSICLSTDGNISIEKETEKAQAHSRELTAMIQDLFADHELSLSDLHAIALSVGPGSYTGLRVGSAVAKGLCYALDIPIITISTLQSLASQYTTNNEGHLIVPMLDARRDEVYMAILDDKLNYIKHQQAQIITEGFLEQYLNDNSIIEITLCGTGADKASTITANYSKAKIYECKLTSRTLSQLSFENYKEGNFADLAYFDLDYIKAPNITTSKKMFFK